MTPLLCSARSEELDRRKERRPRTRSIFFESRSALRPTPIVRKAITVTYLAVSRIWLARPSWTRMSSQRGFLCVKPLAKQASVLAWVKSELTGVSLASHAARVASFVHCRTRGCEAIFSTLYYSLFSTIFNFTYAFLFYPSAPFYFQFVIARPIH